MNVNIKMIWSDFGGVLTPPIAPAMEDFCRARGSTSKALLSAMNKVADDLGATDALEPIDRPLLSESDWLRRVEKYSNITMPSKTLADTWFHERPLNTQWVQELNDLHESGFSIGVLSNMPPAWEKHCRKMLDGRISFNEFILSHQFGLRKPEREFFALAETVSGTRPNENVLIDDLEENCQGAREAGWHAIRFVTVKQTTEELYNLTNRTALTAVQTECISSI